MCSFLSRIDNSVIVGFSFLLLSVSAIILSNTINILHFLVDFIIQYYYKDHPYYLSIQ